MRLSRWRHVSFLEGFILGSLAVSGLIVWVIPVALNTVVRLTLSLGFFVADVPVILEVDSRLQEREWRHYRRPTSAYFLRYGITRVYMSDSALERDPGYKYRERSKQLLLALGIGDPTLLQLVDYLYDQKLGGGKWGSFGELARRLGWLLTDRESHYLRFWTSLAGLVGARVTVEQATLHPSRYISPRGGG